MEEKYEPTREGREEKKARLQRKRQVERMRVDEAEDDWGGDIARDPESISLAIYEATDGFSRDDALRAFAGVEPRRD